MSSRKRSSSRSAISSAAEHLDARRGELDRERDAVEPAADARRAPRRPASRRANPGSARAARSANSRAASCSIASAQAGRRRRQRQRRHGPDRLGRQAERLAAGGQERQRRRTARSSAAGDLARALEHVLAVVEHEQHARGPRSARTTASAGVAPGSSRAHRRAARAPATTTSRVRSGARSAKQRSVRTGAPRRDELDREARLAGASGAVQGHEPLGRARSRQARRAPRSRPTNDVSGEGSEPALVAPPIVVPRYTRARVRIERSAKPRILERPVGRA